MLTLAALLCFIAVSAWARERYLRVWYSSYSDNIDKLCSSLKVELNRLASELAHERSQQARKPKDALDKLDEWHKADPDNRHFTTCESHVYLEDYATADSVTYAVRRPSYVAADSVLPAGATEESPASSSATVLAALEEWDRRKLARQQPKENKENLQP